MVLNLPDEIVVLIAQSAPSRAALCLACTCKHFKQLLDNVDFWRIKYQLITGQYSQFPLDYKRQCLFEQPNRLWLASKFRKQEIPYFTRCCAVSKDYLLCFDVESGFRAVNLSTKQSLRYPRPPSDADAPAAIALRGHHAFIMANRSAAQCWDLETNQTRELFPWTTTAHACSIAATLLADRLVFVCLTASATDLPPALRVVIYSLSKNTVLVDRDISDRSEQYISAVVHMACTETTLAIGVGDIGLLVDVDTLQVLCKWHDCQISNVVILPGNLVAYVSCLGFMSERRICNASGERIASYGHIGTHCVLNGWLYWGDDNEPGVICRGIWACAEPEGEPKWIVERLGASTATQDEDADDCSWDRCTMDLHTFGGLVLRYDATRASLMSPQGDKSVDIWAYDGGLERDLLTPYSSADGKTLAIYSASHYSMQTVNRIYVYQLGTKASAQAAKPVAARIVQPRPTRLVVGSAPKKPLPKAAVVKTAGAGSKVVAVKVPTTKAPVGVAAVPKAVKKV
eukprot:TRINITY_DN8968_c0_g1_i1.p1 TRINITY_DN8968_c0_g1~~TRINITY_DN8968_c0_g1_i1.p1  ORF type:complete len:514 (+),score=69.24 TRINITY_DN8968_c0_g1_i1:99-1640(+)